MIKTTRSSALIRNRPKALLETCKHPQNEWKSFTNFDIQLRFLLCISHGTIIMKLALVMRLTS